MNGINKRLITLCDGIIVRKTCDVRTCDLKARHINPNTNLKLCDFCFRRCLMLQRKYGTTQGLTMFLDEVELKKDAMQPIPKALINGEPENLTNYVGI